MSKVKDVRRFPYRREDGTKDEIMVLWTVDDEEGYAVGIESQEAELTSFVFGQDEEDVSYELSFKAFCCIGAILEKNLDKGLEIVYALSNAHRREDAKYLSTIKAFINQWILLSDAAFPYDKEQYA